MEQAKKKILFVGAEAMPFAATGGLGDVMGSLPAALAKEGCDVRVVLPLYEMVSEEYRKKMKQVAVYDVNLAWRKLYCGAFELSYQGVTYYFLDNEYYFKRQGLYGFYDDGERYAYFCMAALELLAKVNFYPDVLHAHDWQAALAVVYLGKHFRWRKGYENIRTVFTIHNIEYQGQYDFAILGDVFDLDDNDHALMEHGGCINLMKGAIESCDRVTTVSPRYAEEIKMPEYAHGLEGCLAANSYKLRGILNGIDYNYYDPKTDKDLAATYSSRSLSGKTEDKLAFQKEMALPERADVPMLAVISRLAAHKGIDILSECIYPIVENNDLQLVILGKGEARYEDFFRELEHRFPDKVRSCIQYDRSLSKRIYAASDIFLMPSKSEPCGLSQMIASRYGSVPVVRETGGLYDSIKPFWMEGDAMHGNGFTFANYSSGELYDRVAAALSLYQNKELFARLVRRAMTTDFSWKASASQYLSMYEEL